MMARLEFARPVFGYRPPELTPILDELVCLLRRRVQVISTGREPNRSHAVFRVSTGEVDLDARGV